MEIDVKSDTDRLTDEKESGTAGKSDRRRDG